MPPGLDPSIFLRIITDLLGQASPQQGQSGPSARTFAEHVETLPLTEEVQGPQVMPADMTRVLEPEPPPAQSTPWDDIIGSMSNALFGNPEDLQPPTEPGTIPRSEIQGDAISGRQGSIYEQVVPLGIRQALRPSGGLVSPFAELLSRFDPTPADVAAGPAARLGQWHGRARSAATTAERQAFQRGPSMVRNPNRARAQGFLDNPQMFHYTPSTENITSFRPGAHFGTPVAAEERARALMDKDFGLEPSNFLTTAEGVIPQSVLETNNIMGARRGLDSSQRASMADFGQWLKNNRADPSLGTLIRNGMREGERVLPVRARGNFLHVPDMSNWKPEDVAMMLIRRGHLTATEILEPMARIHQPDEAMRGIWDLLIDKGYTGFSYMNKYEDPGSVSYQIFQPNRVRLPWADFDPARMGSDDLLAGVAPLLAGGAAGAAATQFPPRSESVGSPFEEILRAFSGGDDGRR